VDIWYDSVGRGANLLLNIPPDRRGLIHENDVKSLKEMRRILDDTFTVNLIRGVRVTGSNIRNDASNFLPDLAVDGDPNSYWALNDEHKTATLVAYPTKPITFDVVKIREHIPLGQRVEEFMVEYHDGTDWKELVKGTTIGPRRIIRTPKVTAERVRLRILKSIACPVISDIGVYRQPEE
jgi:alpha-L-fucosidase